MARGYGVELASHGLEDRYENVCYLDELVNDGDVHGHSDV